jgi:hypothetical protein
VTTFVEGRQDMTYYYIQTNIHRHTHTWTRTQDSSVPEHSGDGHVDAAARGSCPPARRPQGKIQPVAAPAALALVGHDSNSTRGVYTIPPDMSQAAILFPYCRQ